MSLDRDFYFGAIGEFSSGTDSLQHRSANRHRSRAVASASATADRHQCNRLWPSQKPVMRLSRACFVASRVGPTGPNLLGIKVSRTTSSLGFAPVCFVPIFETHPAKRGRYVIAAEFYVPGWVRRRASHRNGNGGGASLDPSRLVRGGSDAPSATSTPRRCRFR